MDELNEAIKIIRELVTEFPRNNLRLKQAYALEFAKEFLTKHDAVENLNPLSGKLPDS